MRNDGNLTIAEIAEGIVACLRNARALLEDATLLVSARRLARGLMCAQAAQQELGKIHLLRLMVHIRPDDRQRWKLAWKKFRQHQTKTAHALADTVDDEARQSIYSLHTALLQFDRLPPALEQMRQASLYVDFSTPQRRWISPSETTASEVEWLLERVAQALQRLENLEQFGFMSERALQIMHEEYATEEMLARGLAPFAENLILILIPEQLVALEAVHRRYFKRLAQEGVISELPDGFTAMGLEFP